MTWTLLFHDVKTDEAGRRDGQTCEMVKAKERDVESRKAFIIAEKARLGGRR